MSAAFISSANLTEAAFDHNIEVGVLSRDRTLAASLSTRFRILIECELLRALPGVGPSVDYGPDYPTCDS